MVQPDRVNLSNPSESFPSNTVGTESEAIRATRRTPSEVIALHDNGSGIDVDNDKVSASTAHTATSKSPENISQHDLDHDDSEEPWAKPHIPERCILGHPKGRNRAYKYLLRQTFMSFDLLRRTSMKSRMAKRAVMCNVLVNA